ncbi:MAG: helix-turn-helix domain-containing protein [Clostridia bacterium]
MKKREDVCDVVFNDLEGGVRGLFSSESIISCFNSDSMPRYREIISNANIKAIFEDADMLSTIDQFFKNSLNISQTSKKAYMHRNTLIYRIEKVRKLTGLNLKNFDDAVIFENLKTIKKILD